MTDEAKKDAGKAPAKAPEAVNGPDPLGTDKGYIGERVDPRDDSEHSLESGPDSPSALDVRADTERQRAEAVEASSGDNR